MLDNKLYNNLYFNWWRNLDKTILMIIILLFTLGLLFSLLSTSLVASDRLNTNNYFFFLKHCLFILIGISTMFFFSILGKNKLFFLSYILFLIFFVTLILVPFIGTEVKGSKRWLDIFFLPRFQPIEILKPFIIILISTALTFENKNYQYIKYFVSFLLILPIISLLASQPDIGQTILIFFTWLALIFISGINLYLFFSFFSVILFSVASLILFFPKFQYILIRITSFFDPSSGNNYQAEKASEAIISGGFFGKGILHRLKLQLQSVRSIYRLRPQLIIVCSLDLLPWVYLYRIIRKCKVVYDVQENYQLNVCHLADYNWSAKWRIPFIRFVESLSAKFVDHFFLAEKCYKNQLKFSDRPGWSGLCRLKLANITSREPLHWHLLESHTITVT